MTTNLAIWTLAAGVVLGVLWGLFRDLFARHLMGGRCTDCRMATIRRQLRKLQGFAP